ncbi:MAG: hypothetical protein ACYDBB_05485 [Armatimonadota bacterium]
MVGLSVKKTIQRRRVWFILLALSVLLIGLWWWRNPRSYRLVGTYPVIFSTPTLTLPCAAAENGFLLHESANVFVFRDWQGNLRWQIQAAAPSYRSWKVPGSQAFSGQDYGRMYHLSRDGHYLAMASVADANLRIQMWHDGKLTGDVQVPFSYEAAAGSKILNSPYLSSFFDLRALNDGRIYLILPKHTCCEVIIIQNGRIIASGDCRYQQGFWGGIDFAGHVTSDGNILVGSSIRRIGCQRIKVSGKSILFTTEKKVAVKGYSLHDTPLLGYSAPYSVTKGQPTFDDVIAYSTNGEVVIQCMNQKAWRAGLSIHPIGSASVWSLPEDDVPYKALLNNDGRFVLLYKNSNRLASMLSLHYAPVYSWLSLRLSYYYLLIEQPGKIRAVIKPASISSIRNLYPIALSPDGSALLTTVEDHQRNPHCMLFRWR